MAYILRPTWEKRTYVESVIEQLKRKHNIEYTIAPRDLNLKVSETRYFPIKGGDFLIRLPQDDNLKQLIDSIGIKLKNEKGIDVYLIDATTLAISKILGSEASQII